MKKLSKGQLVFYVVLVISVLMVNPPILGMVNAFCVANPLTLSFPTLWLWLEFWFVVMIVDFVIAAVKIRDWDCRQDKTSIEPVTREKL